jgi:uncharacterized membrane protein
MWPWGHAAVGYILWVAIVRIYRREWPTRDEIIVVLAGTQVPDLVDKSLAWTFGFLPSGRSLAHSLLTAIVVIAIALTICRYYERIELAAAFSIGYLSHLFTDLPDAVLSGDFSRATFLFWPLLPSPEYSTEQSLVAHLLIDDITKPFLIQLLLAAVLILVSIINVIIIRAE